ncbi:lysine-2,3-aminomutase-like protein [Pararhodospirillum photometricum]|nr:lysine-2,3-aminomutase-like protein [Pararhodospirillum photometricum]
MRSLDDLEQAGLIPPPSPEQRAAADAFGVLLPPALARLIDPSDPSDPIAAQVIPSAHERTVTPDEISDPIGDAAHSPLPGLVHRYPDRVLLKLTGLCAVNCRFCFRRDLLTQDVLRDADLEAALAYIGAHPEVWEVILSGGDPLILSDARLNRVVRRLEAIETVSVIRVHTRLPVANPERVTPALVGALKSPKAVYVMLHCNHPRELTPEARAACARLIDAGLPVLSQSVLLRGVNDRPEVLEALMRAFVATRITPHYLHHGDMARGTSHFRVPLETAQALLRGLRGRLSGLGQPTYILDLPEGHGKVPVGPVFATRDGAGWRVEDPQGEVHAYGNAGSRAIG